VQFCAFKIGNTIGEITFVSPDALNLLLLAFLLVTICEISKKLKTFCNSLIVYCRIHIFLFLCAKNCLGTQE
jgi:hypothetical protein